ncbi:hypothetical protein Bmeg_05650 [Bacillus megaterium]|nr:hypothetical protein [Priestia megaterium]
MYLYHVVNSEGHTISFYLRKSRDKQVAKSFFKKALAFWMFITNQLRYVKNILENIFPLIIIL